MLHAGGVTVLPLKPLLMTNFFASRGGTVLHCEHYTDDAAPQVRAALTRQQLVDWPHAQALLACKVACTSHASKLQQHRIFSCQLHKH